MMKVLWVFIAFAFGLMLFVSIQDKLPDELSFLKGTPGAVTVPAASSPGAAGAAKTGVVEGWTLHQQGSAIEATRRFSGELAVSGTTYDVPEIGVLCNNGKLDARIDSRLGTTGVKTTRVVVDGEASEWDKGHGSNVFPRDAVAFVHSLLKRDSAAVTVSYVELGAQTSSLDTRGLKKVLELFPAGCQ